MRATYSIVQNSFKALTDTHSYFIEKSLENQSIKKNCLHQSGIATFTVVNNACNTIACSINVHTFNMPMMAPKFNTYTYKVDLNVHRWKVSLMVVFKRMCVPLPNGICLRRTTSLPRFSQVTRCARRWWEW